MRKQVRIWTDGACSGNPGPGGWGAILEYRSADRVYRKELSGGDPATTNNRMELTGAIEALSKLNEPCDVTLYSDSQYLVDSISKGWAKGWQKRGWIKADKTPAKNPELFERLRALRAELARKTGCRILMETELDPELIGGFVFEISGRRLDASVRHRLDSIGRQFTETNRRIV